MRFTDLIVSAAAVGSAHAAAADRKRQGGGFDFVGVNQAGAEFGQDTLPGQLGKHYTWPESSAIDTLMQDGFNTFRVPFMERIIPDELTGSINETYAAGLDETVEYITGKGAYAVVDPHNFGRYYEEVISDTASFGAWWSKVAARYADNELVIFDTNNEYHDMDNALVGQLNQAAIDAIRAAGATSQYIFVEGNSWSGAWHWISSGTAEAMLALTDPEDKLVYEMHQYLDEDGSGTHEACVSATIGRERLEEATAWLKENGLRGVLGETAGGVNDQCVAAVRDMLAYMQENTDAWTGWLWWAGGPWWADYMYSIEPPSGPAYTGFLPEIKEFVSVA